MTAAGLQEPGVAGKISAGLKDLSAWGKENPQLAKLGAQGLSYALGSGDRAQLRGMQTGALDRLNTVNAKNDELVANANANAAQMRDQALSEGPQTLAQRGYSSAQAQTGRQLAGIDATVGLDPAAKAALKQKAQVAGAANAVTGYNTGYGTGAAAQRAGLSAASGMQQKYSGAGYDQGLYADMTKQSNSDSAGLTDMIEGLIGNPSEVVAKRKTAEGGATQYGA